MNRGPRTDEQIACEVILAYLRVNEAACVPIKVNFEPNGHTTPPDYIFYFGTHQVLLEVRVSEDGYILRPEAHDSQFCAMPDCILPKEGNFNSRSKMFDKVDKLVKECNFLLPNEFILVNVFDMSLLSGKNMDKKIVNLLRGAYPAMHEEPKKRFPILPFGSKDDCSGLVAILYHSKTTVEVVVGFSDMRRLGTHNNVFQCSLDAQAHYILELVITEKDKKLDHLSGEKWLAIYNTHPILEADFYKRIFNEELEINSSFKRSFSRIFLIEGQQAYELTPSVTYELNSSDPSCNGTRV